MFIMLIRLGKKQVNNKIILLKYKKIKKGLESVISSNIYNKLILHGLITHFLA